MKKGAGTDPFDLNGEDSDEGRHDQPEDEDEDTPSLDETEVNVDVGSDNQGEGDVASPMHSDDDAFTNTTDTAVDSGEEGEILPQIPHTSAEDGGVPWVYTRSNVKQDRDMVQFYLREFVQDAEDDFVDAVEQDLGASVSKTDVREAAYVAAMRRPEIVADELERWGFEGE